jgi:hypothetical protein
MVGSAVGSRRKAQVPLTCNSNGLLSVVPTKLLFSGLVPALPMRFQALVTDPGGPGGPTVPTLAIASVLPLGVIVTFVPAAKVTASIKPLRLLTT